MSNIPTKPSFDQLHREWQSLTLADDFIFSRVLRDKEICREILELLLKVRIQRIEFPSVQKVIKTLRESKGVRLDVYVQEAGGQQVFDIEMQTSITKEEALRARYYQGIIDVDHLLQGADYKQLPKSYIIFLCMEDPFGLGLPVYRERKFIDPDNRHPHDDRTQKIFYNVSRFQEMEDPAIRSLMEYLNDKKPTDRLTRRLDEMVEELKMIEMGFTDYMAMRQHDLDCIRRGREQGISIGLERGAYQNKLETARNFLSEGLAPQMVTRCTDLPLETVQQLQQEL